MEMDAAKVKDMAREEAKGKEERKEETTTRGRTMTVNLNQIDSDAEKQQNGTSIITKQAERSTKKKNKMEKTKEKTGEEEGKTAERSRSRTPSREGTTTSGKAMESSTTTTTEGSDNS